MGTGSSGSTPVVPGNIDSGSQEFKASYNVVTDLFKKDKADPNIYDPTTGYFHNPTAIDIEKSFVDNKIHIDGKVANGNNFLYVIREDGQMVIGKRCNPNNKKSRSPHPTLIGGKNPKAKCAGLLHIINGKIYDINNQSGHYKPPVSAFDAYVRPYMKKLATEHPEMFVDPKKWR